MPEVDARDMDEMDMPSACVNVMLAFFSHSIWYQVRRMESNTELRVSEEQFIMTATFSSSIVVEHFALSGLLNYSRF